MAELHLERKRSSTGLWIVLGLVLLALLAWWLLGRGDGARQTDAGDVAPVGAAVTEPVRPAGADAADGTLAGAPDAVNDYLRYTTANRARRDADHTHQYTADGIRRLSAALSALADRDAAGDAALRARGTTLRERADALQRDPGATNHAEQARAAFVAAADMMHALGEHRATAASETAALRDAATAVRPDALLLQQTAEVQRFFDDAASALRVIATRATT